MPRPIVLLGVLMLTILPVQAEVIFRDIDNQPRTLKDYRGKWLVANFWASWCPPCLKEIPELKDFQRNHAREAQVVGITFEEMELEPLKRFVARHGITYPVFQYHPDAEQAIGPVAGLPTTYVYDPKGQLAARLQGQITAAQLERIVRGEKP